MKTIKVPVCEEWTVSMWHGPGTICVSLKQSSSWLLSAERPLIPDRVARHPEVVAEINRLSREYLDGLPISGTVTGWVASARSSVPVDGYLSCEANVHVVGEDAKLLGRVCRSGRKFEITFREKP